jgi:hypothetical protein
MWSRLCCSKEANQAFKTGVKSAGPARPQAPHARKKKKGYASCAKNNQKQQTNDEQWAKRRPRLTEALEVKRQPSAVGRGLFVRKSYKAGFEKGDAIGEYVGERILEDEYQARMERYIAQKEFNYFVDVVPESGDASGLYIDATKKGNWTRFVNNSHDPNAQFEPVVIDNTYHIFLVAIKKIRPGEEVTIDYGAEYRSPDQKFVECTCTAKNCSGVIGVQLEKAFIRKLLLEDIHYKDDDLNVLCAENRVLETQNQQYRKQISMFRSSVIQKVSQLVDQTFIPLCDRRPGEVRESNNSIVQGLHQELAVSIRNPDSESRFGKEVIPGPPNLTPYANNQVAVPNRKSTRSASRSSLSGKRPAETATSEKVERPVSNPETDRSASAVATPPQKKRRTSAKVLSVQKLADVTIESTASEYPDGQSSNSNSPAPSERVRRNSTPAPILQNATPCHSKASDITVRSSHSKAPDVTVRSSHSKEPDLTVRPSHSKTPDPTVRPPHSKAPDVAPRPSHSKAVSISSGSSHSDCDSDIIEVSVTSARAAVCALEAPVATSSVKVKQSSSDRQSESCQLLAQPQKSEPIEANVLPKPGNLIDSAISWYKDVCRTWSNAKSGDPELPRCPVHRSLPMNKMREFRQHFFTKHAGAANQYKRQLEAMGGTLSESEKKLFLQTQNIQKKI